MRARIFQRAPGLLALALILTGLRPFAARAEDSGNENSFVAPYVQSYVVTWDCHEGFGGCDIDLAAVNPTGQGASIVSPIDNAVVSAMPSDGYGNPQMCLENSRWKACHLHYTNPRVGNGDIVRQGEVVAQEGNLGNCRCWDDNPPNGRSCGYHSHWGVYDKRLGVWVSILEVINGTIPEAIDRENLPKDAGYSPGPFGPVLEPRAPLPSPTAATVAIAAVGLPVEEISAAPAADAAPAPVATVTDPTKPTLNGNTAAWKLAAVFLLLAAGLYFLAAYWLIPKRPKEERK